VAENDNMTGIESKIMAKKAFVWGIGRNKDGELGIGSQKDTLLPRSIAGMLKDGQSA
jgi:hypothetical protein